jgi:hypothetical protein
VLDGEAKGLQEENVGVDVRETRARFEEQDVHELQDQNVLLAEAPDVRKSRERPRGYRVGLIAEDESANRQLRLEAIAILRCEGTVAMNPELDRVSRSADEAPKTAERRLELPVSDEGGDLQVRGKSLQFGTVRRLSAFRERHWRRRNAESEVAEGA